MKGAGKGGCGSDSSGSVCCPSPENALPRLADAALLPAAKATPPGSGAAEGSGGAEADAGGTPVGPCTVVKLAAVAVLGIRPVPDPAAGFMDWAGDSAASLDLLPDQPRLSRSS